MTAATISNWSFQLGSSASPQVLTAIEEVTDFPNFGVDNELVEVTNFDSGGSKEYIAGLADGVEFTITSNYIPNAAAQVIAMVAAEAKATRLFRAIYTGSSPQLQWNCSVVCLGYTLGPSHSEANTIEFKYKITGSLVRS